MGITLSSIITGVRDAHPAFDNVKVGEALLARWLTDYQRRLMMKALNYNKQLIVAVMPVTLIPSGDNIPAYAGAGQSGSLPAASASSTATVAPEESDVGSAVSIVEGAVIVAETVATGGGATLLSKAAAGWTVNAYADKLVKIVRGTGAGQSRQIISNTSSALVTDEWATPPDDTSVFTILEYSLTAAGDTLSVVTDFPQTDTKLGYVVKTDATGTPYIDWTVPVMATVGLGIPLPQMLMPIGGTVYYDDGETDPLILAGYGARYRAPAEFSVYIQNNELFLVGGIEDWEEIRSFEFRYVPIAPALTKATDLFLLPDSASDVLTQFGAMKAGIRCSGLGIQLDTRTLAEQYVAAETEWLQMLSQQRRARRTIMRG